MQVSLSVRAILRRVFISGKLRALHFHKKIIWPARSGMTRASRARVQLKTLSSLLKHCSESDFVKGRVVAAILASLCLEKIAKNLVWCAVPVKIHLWHLLFHRIFCLVSQGHFVY